MPPGRRSRAEGGGRERRLAEFTNSRDQGRHPRPARVPASASGFRTGSGRGRSLGGERGRPRPNRPGSRPAPSSARAPPTRGIAPPCPLKSGRRRAGHDIVRGLSGSARRSRHRGCAPSARPGSPAEHGVRAAGLRNMGRRACFHDGPEATRPVRSRSRRMPPFGPTGPRSRARAAPIGRPRAAWDSRSRRRPRPPAFPAKIPHGRRETAEQPCRREARAGRRRG